MKRETVFEACVIAVLVGVGVADRLMSHTLGMHNFASVAAIALFAGFYLSRPSVAVLVPLAIMGISNLFLPIYDTRWEALCMYGLLAAPVACRLILRQRLTAWRVAACSLGMSLVFFLGSNLAHWVFQYDEHTLASLAKCYLDALPFLKGTVLGDATFSAVLFGSYALAARYGYLPAVPQRQTVRVRSS